MYFEIKELAAVLFNRRKQFFSVLYHSISFYLADEIISILTVSYSKNSKI